MKKNFLFAMAMAAVFAGCSSDDDPVANAGGEVNGDKFISLSINLPTQNSTRAFDEDNDHLQDGLESEYSVKTAELYIFSGTELSSEFVSKLELSSSFTNNDDNPNQVTQTSTKVVKEVPSGVKAGYGMLVVLNNNGQLSDLTGKTLQNVLDMQSDNMPTNTTNGLFMTNAPLADAVGSDSWAGNIKLLVPITKVYESESAAQAGNADQIYVERAVAKVTMQQVASGQLETGSIEGNKVDWSITGWNLGNTNNTTYIVRNTLQDDMNDWAKLKSNAPSTSYRFIGTNKVTGSDYYRTYFAKDPNYDSDATGLINPTTLNVTFGDNNPIYCMENTFDVDRMINKNTTHAIISASLGDGKDLYVVNDEKNIIYNDINKVNAIVYNAIPKSVLAINLTGEVTLEDFTIEYIATADATHNLAVKSITLKDGSKSKYGDYGSGVNTALSSEITTINNNKVKISKYDDGVSYYAARIKHFDNETPWKDGENPTPSYENIYPNDKKDANYLGRYGVLRNNWYDLKVTKISLIGEPTIDGVKAEESDTDTDDELDAFISLQINILSWAKRTQDVEL